MISPSPPRFLFLLLTVVSFSWTLIDKFQVCLNPTLDQVLERNLVHSNNFVPGPRVSNLPRL